MKKSIIASLLFVMLAIPTFAQASSWYSEDHYDTVECAICGKTVYIYREASIGPYMPSSGTLFSAPSCPGERAYTFYTLINYICYNCERKYSKEFSEHVESFYVDRRFENIKLIEKYQEERRQKGVEDRKNKIIELEKELEGLRK